ncbi:hypothetical protein WA026_011028 [Henosepilachna vigintioctopunctata]|uniref:Uncharacterized protein n=1 Tax=Henosepilachna vigintioctopunctata TaxID=420089 RepID=A0AAW1URU2_9CUCU
MPQLCCRAISGGLGDVAGSIPGEPPHCAIAVQENKGQIITPTIILNFNARSWRIRRKLIDLEPNWMTTINNT